MTPLSHFLDEGMTDSIVSKTKLLLLKALENTFLEVFSLIFANIEHILLYRTYRIVKHKLFSWLYLQTPSLLGCVSLKANI